jgi:hypothetical protein
MSWLGICLVLVAVFDYRHRLARKRRGVGSKPVTTSVGLQEGSHNEADGTSLPEYGTNLHGATTALPPPYAPQK